MASYVGPAERGESGKMVGAGKDVDDAHDYARANQFEAGAGARPGHDSGEFRRAIGLEIAAVQ